MFITKTKKKENIFLKFLALISYVFSTFFIFVPKFDIVFEDLTYKVSYLDVLMKRGILINEMIFKFPFYFKFLIYLSILTSLFSILFLFLKKYRQAFTLMSLIVIPPLTSMIFHITGCIKIGNFNLLFLHIFSSFLTLLLFLLILGLETTVKKILMITTLFCISILLIMVGYLICEGIPAIFEIGLFKFLFGTKWSPSDNLYGIFSFILCSIVVTISSAIIGGVIGVLTSIFLTQFIPEWVSKIIKLFIKVAAGIPSVVYGFFGMLVIVPMIRKIFYKQTTGDSLLAAIIILSIMILPTVISISEEAIKAVPINYLEASVSLGVSKIKSIFKIVLPEAREGIVSSIFLGIGRSIGETMAVIMVSGNAVNLPNLLKPARFLTTAMALEFSYASGLHRKALFAIGLILFFIICIINASFSKILKQRGEK